MNRFPELSHRQAPVAGGRFHDFFARLNTPAGQDIHEPRPSRAADAPVAPVALPARTYSATDLAHAATHASKLARDRFAKVFASPASRGRERGCVALLTHPHGWSAEHIIAQLPHLPTDAEIARGSVRASQPHPAGVSTRRGTGASEIRQAAATKAEKILAAQRKAASPHRSINR